MLGIESELDQIRVLKKIIQEEWSVRKLEAYIRDLNADTKSDRSKRQDVSKANTVFIKDIENKLRSHLGTKVSMKTFTEGGEIRIKYFNEEDLDRLLTVLIAHQ